MNNVKCPVCRKIILSTIEGDMCQNCGHPFNFEGWTAYWLDVEKKRQVDKEQEKAINILKYGKCEICNKVFTAYSKVLHDSHDYCYAEKYGFSTIVDVDNNRNKFAFWEKIKSIFTKRFYNLTVYQRANLDNVYFNRNPNVFYKFIHALSDLSFSLTYQDLYIPNRFKKQINKYPLKKKLGEGRYAICFLSEGVDGKPIVVKYIKKWVYWNKKLKKKSFSNEVSILSRLDHSAVPKHIETITKVENCYIVMEYFQGKSLYNLVYKEKKVFSHEEKLDIFSKAIDILSYLHDNRVIHGDMAPKNILLYNNDLYLIDFDCAYYFDETSFIPTIDYVYLGNLLLFLFYSSCSGSIKGSWDEQLWLNKDQKIFLQKLLGILSPYRHIKEIKKEFEFCFLR